MMTMNERLAEAIREALEGAPGSARAVALEAGVDPSMLTRIQNGERGASPELAAAVANALGRFANRYAAAEALLRRAIEGSEHE